MVFTFIGFDAFEMKDQLDDEGFVGTVFMSGHHGFFE